MFAGAAERGDQVSIGRPGGEVEAGVRSAGLDDHRMALRRAGDVERAVDLEELALVMDGVLLPRVEEQTTLAVMDEGVVVPGVP